MNKIAGNMIIDPRLRIRMLAEPCLVKLEMSRSAGACPGVFIPETLERIRDTLLVMLFLAWLRRFKDSMDAHLGVLGFRIAWFLQAVVVLY